VSTDTMTGHDSRGAALAGKARLVEQDPFGMPMPPRRVGRTVPDRGEPERAAHPPVTAQPHPSPGQLDDAA
jgi:hypothetical protein